MKKVYESKTIISAMYLLVVLMLPVVRDIVTEEEIIHVGQLIMGLFGIGGVIYGRIVAKDKIQIK